MPEPRRHWKVTLRRRWAVVIAATGVFIATGVLVGFSGTVVGEVGALKSRTAPAPAPVPAAPVKPWEEMTQRDYERQPQVETAAAVVEPSAPPLAAAPVVEPPVVPAPVVAAPDVAQGERVAQPAKPIDHRADRPKHARLAKPATKLAAKSAAKPATMVARAATTRSTKPPPRWNPDSLLPGR